MRAVLARAGGPRRGLVAKVGLEAALRQPAVPHRGDIGEIWGRYRGDMEEIEGRCARPPYLAGYWP